MESPKGDWETNLPEERGSQEVSKGLQGLECDLESSRERLFFGEDVQEKVEDLFEMRPAENFVGDTLAHDWPGRLWAGAQNTQGQVGKRPNLFQQMGIRCHPETAAILLTNEHNHMRLACQTLKHWIKQM